MAKAERVRNGEVPFREAVIDGLFVPLGEGGVNIAGVINALEDDGYRGWYVLEQDVSLRSDPPEGEGPRRTRSTASPTCAGSSGIGVSSVPPADRTATCVLPARAQLGECPTWSVREERLYWIDIDGRAVHRFDPSDGHRRGPDRARASRLAGPHHDSRPPPRRDRGATGVPRLGSGELDRLVRARAGRHGQPDE